MPSLQSFSSYAQPTAHRVARESEGARDRILGDSLCVAGKGKEGDAGIAMRHSADSSLIKPQAALLYCLLRLNS